MKGVSPLVASVMLIVIVISLVSLMSGWLNTLFMGTRETVSNRTDESVRCTGASLSIDSVYVTPNSTSGSATAVVRNDGIVDELTITSAVLYNSTGHNFSANTSMPVTSFGRGSIKTIAFVGVSLQDCAAFSQVVVGTNCVSARYKVKPTNC